MVGISPAFSFLVFLSLSPFLSSSLKTLFHFLTLCLPLFSVCCHCLELVCSISAPFSFLPSFLPSSFPSLPSFSPTLHFHLASSTPAVDSPHTQRDLSLFTTRHHWHTLVTATLNYFCMLPACRSLLTCQTASSECRGANATSISGRWSRRGSQLALLGTVLIWSPIFLSKSTVSHRRHWCTTASGELTNWESRDIVCGFWEASMWNFARLLQSAATLVYFCHSSFLLRFSFVTVLLSCKGL